MILIKLLLLFTTIIFAQQEFDFEGPYGINYFDTAGPFKVQDLNSPVVGDVNGDDSVNIQDIVLTVNLVLSGEYNSLADLNSDSTVDILDLVALVNIVLGS